MQRAQAIQLPHGSLMFPPIHMKGVEDADHKVPSATQANTSTTGIPLGFPIAATSTPVTRNSIYHV